MCDYTSSCAFLSWLMSLFVCLSVLLLLLNLVQTYILLEATTNSWKQEMIFSWDRRKVLLAEKVSAVPQLFPKSSGSHRVTLDSPFLAFV